VGLIRKAVPVALLMGLVFSTDASATSPRIMMLNFVFTPNPVSRRMGQPVTWSNEPNNRQSHTTTDSSPLQLWDSGELLGGASFTFTFTAAGTYSYECTLHDFYGMLGTLGVKDVVSPPSGPVGTIFTVTVATVDAPDGMVYDIQRTNPGGPFRNWIIGATVATAQFDSTGQATGIYEFRSRLRRVSDNAATGYSPIASAEVTS
jgi:plastocyanin